MIGRILRHLRPYTERVLNRLAPPVYVLLYHRVTTLACDSQALAVTPTHFRAHLRWLKTCAEIHAFDADWPSTGRPGVVITFDDGYADNLTEALPILEAEGVPATFFVTSGAIDSAEEFWWDELERRVLLGSGHPASFTFTDDSGRCWQADTGTPAARQCLYERLHQHIRRGSLARRTALLAAVRAWSQASDAGPRTGYRSLSRTELRQLAGSALVVIGGHTIHHHPLSRLDASQQAAEIEGSLHQLEAWTDRPVRVFSYPFGGRCDYDHRTVRLCREAGLRRTASNFPALARPWTDSHQIPRLLVRDGDERSLAALLGRWGFPCA